MLPSTADKVFFSDEQEQDSVSIYIMENLARLSQLSEILNMWGCPFER